MAGHIITLTPTQWQELQNNESIVIGGVTYDYNEENLYMVVEPPYRVGDIVISTKNESPARVYGGSWEQLPEGYALWTTTSEIINEKTDRTILAGLPNIKGSVGGTAITGVTTPFTQIEKEQVLKAGTDYSRTLFEFNANTYNPIYRDDVDTVQPPAYKIYAWKRIGDNEV